MSSNSTSTTTIPGLPEPEVPEVISPADVFVLYYRRGNDVLNIQFQFKKPTPELTAREHFSAAVERARTHCERMRYKFLWARPYVVSLEDEERRMPL